MPSVIYNLYRHIITRSAAMRPDVLAEALRYVNLAVGALVDVLPQTYQVDSFGEMAAHVLRVLALVNHADFELHDIVAHRRHECLAVFR